LKQVVLPGAVGADQRVRGCAAPHLQVDVVDGDEALELLDQAFIAAQQDGFFGGRHDGAH
jgi:hypothetical protein